MRLAKDNVSVAVTISVIISFIFYPSKVLSIKFHIEYDRCQSHTDCWAFQFHSNWYHIYTPIKCNFIYYYTLQTDILMTIGYPCGINAYSMSVYHFTDSKYNKQISNLM